MQTKNRQIRKRAAENGFKVCLVTRESLPREEMLRFVISPAGTVVFDVAERLPGAGLWIKADKSVLQTAVSKHIFNKAAGGSVKINETFIDSVETALKDYCLSLLGMARKAGLLVFGFENVKKRLASFETGVAFEASDAAKNGQNKLFRPTDSFPVFSFLSREELGQITGQAEQVHLWVTESKLAEKLKQTATKITLYTKD